MTCPRCSAPLAAESSTCAACGLSLFRNVSGIIKTSVVMISTGGESSFYASVQEVPEPLRGQLIESTSGGNAGTIVIADRAGKEQLTQGMARRLANTIGTASRAITESPGVTAVEAAAPDEKPPARMSWLAWAGGVLVLALGLGFALFFGMRW